MAELNRFFNVVIQVVHDQGGWVNKFEGDAALCIFGAPGDQPDHADRALRAAAALPSAVAALPDHDGDRGGVRVGIGVACGSVVVGNIGTPERYEYTVIGDAVNVAARLTELAKRPFHGVLASEETLRSASDPELVALWREAGTVVLRGRSRPTRLFEPAGRLDDDQASGSGSASASLASAGGAPAAPASVTAGSPSSPAPVTAESPSSPVDAGAVAEPPSPLSS